MGATTTHIGDIIAGKCYNLKPSKLEKFYLQVLKYFASPPDLLPCVNCAKSIHVRMSVVVDAVVVSAAAL